MRRGGWRTDIWIRVYLTRIPSTRSLTTHPSILNWVKTKSSRDSIQGWVLTHGPTQVSLAWPLPLLDRCHHPFCLHRCFLCPCCTYLSLSIYTHPWFTPLRPYHNTLIFEVIHLEFHCIGGCNEGDWLHQYRSKNKMSEGRKYFVATQNGAVWSKVYLGGGKCEVKGVQYCGSGMVG